MTIGRVGITLPCSTFIRPAGITPRGPHKAEQPTDPPGRCQFDSAAENTSRREHCILCRVVISYSL